MLLFGGGGGGTTGTNFLYSLEPHWMKGDCNYKLTRFSDLVPRGAMWDGGGRGKGRGLVGGGALFAKGWPGTINTTSYTQCIDNVNI